MRVESDVYPIRGDSYSGIPAHENYWRLPYALAEFPP
jgi:hypothetical protein